MDGRIDSATTLAMGATHAGATAAVWGSFSANEISMFGGLLISFAGLIYHIWHTTQIRKIQRGTVRAVAVTEAKERVRNETTRNQE